MKKYCREAYDGLLERQKRFYLACVRQNGRLELNYDNVRDYAGGTGSNTDIQAGINAFKRDRDVLSVFSAEMDADNQLVKFDETVSQFTNSIKSLFKAQQIQMTDLRKQLTAAQEKEKEKEKEKQQNSVNEPICSNENTDSEIQKPIDNETVQLKGSPASGSVPVSLKFTAFQLYGELILSEKEDDEK